MENGTYLDKGNITFEKITQIWLEDYAEVKLEPKTVERYVSASDKMQENAG